MKKYMVWDHAKHKAKRITGKQLKAFDNWQEILKAIEAKGEWKNEFWTITEYEVKERKRWL